MSKRILVISDPQNKPGAPTDHMYWLGLYAAKIKPDIIVAIGDFHDFPSMSSWDKGKKSYEGRRYLDDYRAGNYALYLFEAGCATANEGRKYKLWNPRKLITFGNHEYRQDRVLACNPELEGVIGYHLMNWEEHGWETYPFRQAVEVEGVAFNHYFASGTMGRPVTSAKLLLGKKHQSSVMGHVQIRDIAYASDAMGRSMTAIFTGAYYQHFEEYLGPEGNKVWYGVWVLNDVHDGSFDEMPVSMRFLHKRYGDLTKGYRELGWLPPTAYESNGDLEV